MSSFFFFIQLLCQLWISSNQILFDMNRSIVIDPETDRVIV